MKANAHESQERNASCADPREKRSQWEAFSITLHPDKSGVIVVVNRSKSAPSSYEVEVCPDGPVSCTCPDWRHREPEGGCKHQIAVAREPALIDAANHRSA